MNDILKQRLVGALILVALGVVFWPIIFVEPGDRGTGEQAGIPERPSVDTAPIEPPDLAGLRPSQPLTVEPEEVETPPPAPAPEPPDPEPTVTPKPQPAPEPEPSVAAKPVESTSRTRTEAPARPAVDADGVPIAWILQVVSVSSADKAEKLRKELLAYDQKAYVKKIKRGDKVLYRVYIGPRFERAPLEKLKGKVDAEYGVSSMITRYYP